MTGRRRLIEPSAGGVKANVAGTSLTRMGTAGEMLAHLPFVTSRNGSLSVLGSGTPEIYINSRKVRDLGELDRLRASEILSAEVITAPGPEYAADVPAVIRIRTLRQRGEGWNGRIFSRKAASRPMRTISSASVPLRSLPGIRLPGENGGRMRGCAMSTVPRITGIRGSGWRNRVRCMMS